MRKRLQVLVTALLLCCLLLISSPLAVCSADIYSSPAVTKGLDYLAQIQNTDGGFPSDQGRSSAKSTTAWVIMALKAAGEDIESGRWVKNGNTPIDYLKTGSTVFTATTDYARVLLALRSAGAGNVFQGENLADTILSYQQENGQFAQIDKGEQEMINSHMWSVLALASADKSIPQKEKALAWLCGCQNEDGGFSWAKGLASDPDDTGVALAALVLLGEKPQSSSTIKKALEYLKKHKNSDGGYTWTGNKSNTATDAWVIQGLLAAGEDPASTVDHLLGFQNEDGSFNWTKDVKSSPVLMTSYAIMALCKKPIPVNTDFTSLVDKDLKISLYLDKKEAFINGNKEVLDVAPVLINNRTMVPLRFVGERLGAGFQWFPETSSIDITYQGKTFNLPVGQPTEELETPALIEAGRTLVPLRYISEKLGAAVKWIEKERRIDIER